MTGYDGGGLVNANGFTVDLDAAHRRRCPTLHRSRPATGTFTTLHRHVYQRRARRPTSGTTAATGQQLAGGDRAGGQDDPDPDAVHPDRRRRPTPTATPLTYLWEQTDPAAAAGTAPGQQHQDRRSAVPAVRHRRTGHARRTRSLYHSPGREPRRHRPEPDLPGPRADPGRQHQRRDRHLPGAGRRHHGAASPTRRSTASRSSCRPTAWVGSPAGRVLHFRLTARDEFTPDGRPTTPGGVSGTTWR